jgi:callose synthase
LLYHNALSANVVVSDILKYARKSKDSGGSGEVNEDLLDQVNELKKVVQRQEKVLQNMGLSAQDTSPPSSEVSEEEIPQRPVSATNTGMPRRNEFGGKRAKSMSGMELWGDMAVISNEVDDSYAAQISSPRFSQPTSGDFQFSPHPDTMPPR